MPTRELARQQRRRTPRVSKKRAATPSIPVATESVSKLGRPRSETCHNAILRATNSLLGQVRYGDLTMEKIAQRAEVSKQTLYKWWPSKSHLVIEAYACRIDKGLLLPDTGNVREDLFELLVETCSELSRPDFGGTMAGLISDLQSDPELANRFRTSFVSVRRARAIRVLERGVERGEISGETDFTLLLDLVYGSSWHRLLMKHAPLDEVFARRVIDAVLDGVALQKARSFR